MQASRRRPSGDATAQAMALARLEWRSAGASRRWRSPALRRQPDGAEAAARSDLAYRRKREERSQREEEEVYFGWKKEHGEERREEIRKKKEGEERLLAGEKKREKKKRGKRNKGKEGEKEKGRKKKEINCGYPNTTLFIKPNSILNHSESFCPSNQIKSCIILYHQPNTKFISSHLESYIIPSHSLLVYPTRHTLTLGCNFKPFSCDLWINKRKLQGYKRHMREVGSGDTSVCGARAVPVRTEAHSERLYLLASSGVCAPDSVSVCACVRVLCLQCNSLQNAGISSREGK